MTRIQHPWNKWEDYRSNFYGGIVDIPKKDVCLEKYAALLIDLDRFERALNQIITEWVYSCEHNLTNKNLNRVAYMGQAACALEFNIPHYVSCSGYNLLTPDQQAKADEMAQFYIDLWTENHNMKGTDDVAA